MKNNTKLVQGVGINDADYEVSKKETINGKRRTVWECVYYLRWRSMLTRCYSKKLQDRLPTYKGCSVCEEWLVFSNFKKWMDTQDWKGRQLDKDFLIESNKIYSPNACVFLPSKLNNFITVCGKTRGQYPLGVRYSEKHKRMINERSKPYMSQISSQTDKLLYLGHYFTPHQAHQAYLKAKLKQCEDYLKDFKDEYLIIKGLTRIKDKIKYHINNKLELTSF